jgi:hypothetical protein
MGAVAAVILATLHWSGDARRLRPLLQCGPTPEADPPADGSERRYALYLVTGATPEEACERARRQSQAPTVHR